MSTLDCTNGIHCGKVRHLSKMEYSRYDTKLLLMVRFQFSRSAESGVDCHCYYSDGGARGVVVIVVGIGHGDTSSNPGRD